jgi:hypothetical protein
MIGMRLVGETTTRKVISIDDAAVRKQFYRRTRPDGTPIDDIEWSLSHIESAAAPLLQNLGDRWPLSFEAKAILAELFSVQLVRGTRWKNWHETFSKQFVDEQRDAEDPTTITRSEQTVEVVSAAELERHLLGDTNRLMGMLSLGRKLASAFGSMHWTLVKFAAPLLATSDHPIVLWPRDARARGPEATPMNLGVLETLEVRVPMSPKLAILMTWGDWLDTGEARVNGARHHAEGLNAFTIAEADRQWFHWPTKVPPVGSGSFLPLSVQLLANYDAQAAATSRRRATISAQIQPKIGAPPEPEFEMVRVTAPSGS